MHPLLCTLNLNIIILSVLLKTVPSNLYFFNFIFTLRKDLVISYELGAWPGPTRPRETDEEGDFNKTKNGLVATIVQPDGVSRIFVITQQKGVIKYPVENGILMQ